MSPLFGWTGTVLRVDCASRTVRREPIAPAVLKREIGGKGLCGFFLEPFAGLDWDHPDSPLLFFTGPLVGTTSPTSGRMQVMGRSPLTGAAFDASVGGSLGTELKKAGLDGLIVTGRSEHPLGLEIVDGEARLVDARALRGLSIGETREVLAAKDAHRFAYAGVGPAAENGALFATIGVDSRHAVGRGGLGTVMAGKGLKYITVRGSGRVRVADPAALAKAREAVIRQTNASPALMGEFGIARYGTAALYDLMYERAMSPTDNFRRVRFEAGRACNAAAVRKRLETVRRGCKGCHILCKKQGRGGEEAPEYETLSHFTALLGQADLGLAIKANAACNELGLDTISAASALAVKRELDGRDFDAEALLAALSDIGHMRGEGAILGLGATRYATLRGAGEKAAAVKGLDLPAYDPRGAYGMALGYAVSTRGGCHLRAYPIGHEILRKPVATDRFSFSGKARIVKLAEDAFATVDSLTACKFVFFAAGLEEYAKVFAAATGEEASADSLLAAGERITYRERIINARLGFSGADDDLPARFFADSEDGLAKGLDREAFLQARSAYWRVRGLDETGAPTPETAARLGLSPL